MIIFLLSLFACGDESDTGSEDTASADTAIEIGANFYCG